MSQQKGVCFSYNGRKHVSLESKGLGRVSCKIMYNEVLCESIMMLCFLSQSETLQVQELPENVPGYVLSFHVRKPVEHTVLLRCKCTCRLETKEFNVSRQPRMQTNSSVKTVQGARNLEITDLCRNYQDHHAFLKTTKAIATLM